MLRCTLTKHGMQVIPEPKKRGRPKKPEKEPWQARVPNVFARFVKENYTAAASTAPGQASTAVMPSIVKKWREAPQSAKDKCASISAHVLHFFPATSQSSLPCTHPTEVALQLAAASLAAVACRAKSRDGRRLCSHTRTGVGLSYLHCTLLRNLLAGAGFQGTFELAKLAQRSRALQTQQKWQSSWLALSLPGHSPPAMPD